MKDVIESTAGLTDMSKIEVLEPVKVEFKKLNRKQQYYYLLGGKLISNIGMGFYEPRQDEQVIFDGQIRDERSKKDVRKIITADLQSPVQVRTLNKIAEDIERMRTYVKDFSDLEPYLGRLFQFNSIRVYQAYMQTSDVVAMSKTLLDQSLFNDLGKQRVFSREILDPKTGERIEKFFSVNLGKGYSDRHYLENSITVLKGMYEDKKQREKLPDHLDWMVEAK